MSTALAAGGPRRESLREVIERYVNLGEKVPVEIVAKIERTYGIEWMKEQAALLAADLTEELASSILRSKRRRLEIAVKPGNAMAKSEMMLASVVLYDDEGLPYRKPFGEASPAELRRKADEYDRLAIGVLRRGRWYRDVAEIGECEGVSRMADVKAELPALPDADEIGI